MKNTKKIFLFAAMITALMLCFAFGASAETYSGNCGDNVTWSLDTQEQTLYISGTGNMASFSGQRGNSTSDIVSTTAPWYSYKSYISKVVIGNGVVSIGSYAFCLCENMTTIHIPASVTVIENWSFYKSGISQIYYGGTEENWNSIPITSYGEYITRANVTFNVEDGEQYPSGYNFEWDRYSFSNLDETISADIYKKAYGTIKGNWLYLLKENGDNHGHCYGMTSTSAALLSYQRAVKYFKSCYVEDYYVETMFELFPEYTSDLFGVDLRTYIKYGYVYQFDNDVQKAEKASKNNLQGLYNSVKAYVNGNNTPVIINVYHDALIGRKDGHSILAIGLKETADSYVILINDSNICYEKQELKIKKDFSSWTYKVNNMYEYSSGNGHLTYSFPADVMYNVGLLLNDNNSNFMSVNNSLVASTQTISTEVELEEVLSSTGSQGEDTAGYNLYWLEDEVKSVEITSLAEDNEVLVSDVETSIKTVLDNNCTASFCVNDVGNSSICVDASIGSDNNIVFISSNNGEIIELDISGTADSSEITATQTETGLLITGISDGEVTLSKNEEVIAVQEITEACSDIEILYDAQGESDSLDVDYHGHSYTTTTTPATCSADGYTTYTCSCGDSYTETIPATGHTYTPATTPATCSANGYTTYTCSCGDSYKQTIPTTGHNYGDDNICDSCGAVKSCDHLCHKSGFMGFIYKIVRFFWKLFKMNAVCDCGAAHY